MSKENTTDQVETVEKAPKKVKEVKKKNEIFNFELPEAQANKFKTKCSDMGIEESRAFELLVKGFLKGKFPFDAHTEYDV
jgi:antitoxin component of RelBE/YafQ-DinJ toxin-antitoxin module